jgi:membrane-associated phospholipid phosphatase
MRLKALFVLLTTIVFFNQGIAQESFLKKNKQWVAPVVLGGIGLALYNHPTKNAQIEFRNQYLPNFQTKIDDFLQFSPTLLFIGANVAQRISSNSPQPIKDKLGVFIIGTATYVGISQILKRGINDNRPDGGNFSFPSGHTTSAFFGARILDKEFRQTKPWLVVGGYTLASATGVLRMANNKHWVNDVFFGAGLGIASAEFAYWLYPKLKSKTVNKQAFHFDPIIAPDFYSARATYTF